MRLKKAMAKSRRFLAFTLALVSCFCVCMSTVLADMGAKPSIQIRVENPPSSEYYLVLFSKESGILTDEEKKAIVKEMGDETVSKLCDLEFDGQRLHTSPAGRWIFKSDEDGKYRFSYMVPTTFTVVLMTKDGTIYKSESSSRSAYVNAFVYDVADGTLKQDPKIPGALSSDAAFFAFCIEQAFSYFFATLFFEWIVLLCFGLSRKENAARFILANLVTQIFLNIFNITFVFLRIPGKYYYIHWFFAEVVITLIEVLWWKNDLKYKYDEIRPKRNLAFAITANAVSAVIDIPIVIIFTIAGKYL